MNIKQKEERLIIAVMVFVLICLLLFSSVAFGQVSDPLCGVHGTVSYSDGRPLPLNDSLNATDIMVVNKDTNENTVFTTNNTGFYDSGMVYEPGNYTVYAIYKNTVVGSHDATLTSGSNVLVDLTTSRMSTN